MDLRSELLAFRRYTNGDISRAAGVDLRKSTVRIKEMGNVDISRAAGVDLRLEGAEDRGLRLGISPA